MKTTWEGLGTFLRFSNAGWSVNSISLAVFVTLITGTRMSNFLYQQPDRWPQIRWPAWHNKIRHIDPEGYDFSLWGRILATVRPLLFPFALPVTRHCKRGWDFCCSLTDHCSTRATSGQIHLYTCSAALLVQQWPSVFLKISLLEDIITNLPSCGVPS